MSEFETNHAVPIQTIVRPFQLPDATIRTGKLAVNLEARVVSVDEQPMHVSGFVKLSSIGRDGGLNVARVMPLRLHGSIARLLLPGRSEASIERPGGVEG